MPYAPTVDDNSGQILANYQMKAADVELAMRQQQAEKFAQIGTAVTQFAAMQQGGKAFKKFMNVAGPSMGISNEQLKMFGNMNDMEAFQLSQNMMPVAPSMVSAAGVGKYYSALAGANQKALTTRALQQPAANQVVSDKNLMPADINDLIP